MPTSFFDEVLHIYDRPTEKLFGYFQGLIVATVTGVILESVGFPASSVLLWVAILIVGMVIALPVFEIVARRLEARHYLKDYLTLGDAVAAGVKVTRSKIRLLHFEDQLRKQTEEGIGDEFSSFLVRLELSNLSDEAKKALLDSVIVALTFNRDYPEGLNDRSSDFKKGFETGLQTATKEILSKITATVLERQKDVPPSIEDVPGEILDFSRTRKI